MHGQDLDLVTTWARGAESEVYDHSNAWTDASSPIYVAVYRYRGGVFQVGYDPATDKHWIRSKSNDEEAAWTAWTDFPPVPPVLPSRTSVVPEAETSKRKR